MSEYCFTPLSFSHMYCAQAVEARVNAASAAIMCFTWTRVIENLVKKSIVLISPRFIGHVNEQ